MNKELQKNDLYYPGGIGNVGLPDGRIGEITQIVTTKEGASTLTVCPQLNFKIPDYIPEVLKKYSIESNQQIIEEAEFEIIQPKLLK